MGKPVRVVVLLTIAIAALVAGIWTGFTHDYGRAAFYLLLYIIADHQAREATNAR